VSPSAPKVSVIMPAYNAEKYIAASIESVCEQSFPDWELIVIDDGSQDSTRSIVQRFTANDPRIKYIFQENGGQARARNTGIMHSQGELIAFLDSDDLWMREKLELQVALLEAQEVDLVFSGGFIFNDDDTTQETQSFEIVSGRLEGAELLNQLYLNNLLPNLSVIVQRQVVIRAGLLDEDRIYQNSEDYDLWLTLAQQGAVFYGMPEMLVRYRRHPDSMTSEKNRVHSMQAEVNVLEKHRSDSRLASEVVAFRLRNAYRVLISALVEARSYREARDTMRELARLEQSNVMTRIQQVLLTICPAKYNVVSNVLFSIRIWMDKRGLWR